MPQKTEMLNAISLTKTLKFDGGFVDLNGREVPLKAAVTYGFPYEPLEMNWELFREVKTVLQDWTQDIVREHKLKWPVMFPDSIVYYAHHCSPPSFRVGSNTERKPNLYIFSKYLLIAQLFDDLITARDIKDDPEFNNYVTAAAELVYKMIILPYDTPEELQEDIDNNLALKKLSDDYAIYFGPICTFSYEFAKELKKHCEISGEEEDTQLKKFAKAVRRRYLCHRIPDKSGATIKSSAGGGGNHDNDDGDFDEKNWTEVVNSNISPRDTYRYEVMGLTPIYELCLLLDDPNAKDDKRIRRLALFGSTMMGLVGDLVYLKRDHIYCLTDNSTDKPLAELKNALLGYCKQGLDWESSLAKLVDLHDETLKGFRKIYDNLMIDFEKSESQKKLVVLIKQLVQHGIHYQLLKGGRSVKFEHEFV